MGNIGFPEMVVIFILALLIFGPKRLPELGKSLGRGIGEFRRASSDLRNSIEREIESAQIPQNPIKEVVSDMRKAASETSLAASQTLSDATKSLAAGSDLPKA